MSNLPVELPKTGVYWARLAGFSYWPVRYCSVPEAERIEKYRYKNTPQVPVYFLASCDLAWVNVASIEPFISKNTFKRLDRSKFKSTIPYRLAVVEALRMAMRAGEKFGPDIIEMANTTDPECAASLAREDVCSKCFGSELGGDALLCDNCNVSETHLHCLTPQLSEAPEGDWFCEECCVLKGLPKNYMPVPPKLKDPESDPEPDGDKDPVSSTAPSSASSRKVSSQCGVQSEPSNGKRGKKQRASATTPAPPDEEDMRHITSVAPASVPITPMQSSVSRSDARPSVLESLQRLMAVGAGSNTDVGDGNQIGSRPNSVASNDPRAEGKGVRGADGLLGVSDTVYNGTIRPCSGFKFPDTCMVCDIGGVLQLCDYPGCRRSYHQTCIPKKFPYSVASSFGQDDNDPFRDDEPWLCPAHFCVRCKALSSGNGMPELGSRSLPSYIMINGDHIRRKPLSSCGKCPMSICLDCEKDIGAGVPLVALAESSGVSESATSGGCGVIPIEISKIADNYDLCCDLFAIFPPEDGEIEQHAAFSSYKTPARREAVLSFLSSRVRLPALMNGSSGADVVEAAARAGFSVGGRAARRKDLINYSENIPKKMPGQKMNGSLIPVCLNCTSTNCHLQLAKSLERLTSSMCNSRMCLPFLRPLLPVGTANRIANSLVSSEVNAHSEEEDFNSDHEGCSSLHILNEGCSTISKDPKYIFQEMREFLGTGACKIFREFHLPRPILRKALCGSKSPYAPREKNSKNRILDALSNESPEIPPWDMIAIFEKIRRLEYQSAGQLLCDLENMRKLVLISLEESAVVMKYNCDSRAAEFKQINWAFDSMLETAKRFDNSNQVLHQKLENTISVQLRKAKPYARRADTNIDGIVEDSEPGGKNGKRARLEFDTAVGYSSKRMKLDENRSSTSRHGLVEDETDQGAPENFHVSLLSSDVVSAQAELLLLWRQECETPIKAAYVSKNYVVQPRIEMLDWCEYLKAGHMPPESKRASSAFNPEETCEFTNGDASESNSNMFPYYGNGKLSWLRAMGIEEMASEVEAAQIMTGFRFNNLRENVSLRHSDDVNTGPLAKEMDPMFTESRSVGLAQDDSYVILEELRETSRRSLMLSAQLQQRLRKQEENLLACASTNITIGEGNLISELKLANDNLRWRLQQKSRALSVCEERADNLKDSIAELSDTIREKDDALAKCRIEISRLRGSGATGMAPEIYADTPKRPGLNPSVGSSESNLARNSKRAAAPKCSLNSGGTLDSLVSMTMDR